jgi:hypothetical protein
MKVEAFILGRAGRVSTGAGGRQGQRIAARQEGDTAQRPAFRVFRFRVATESATRPLPGWAMRNDEIPLLLRWYFLWAPEKVPQRERPPGADAPDQRRALAGPAGGSCDPSVGRCVGAGSAVRPCGAPAAPARIPDASPSLGEPRGVASRHGTARVAAWQDGDTAQRPAFRVFRFRAACGIGDVSPDRFDTAKPGTAAWVRI